MYYIHDNGLKKAGFSGASALSVFRVNHLSNTTCLSQVFFKGCE